MRGMENLRVFNGRICSVFEWVGIFAFLFLMLLTTVDVIGAKIFLAPVPGSLDLMMIGQLVCLSFGFAASYLGYRHVRVEFFMPLFPETVQRVIAVVINLILLALMIVITWQLFVYAVDLQEFNEVSPTIRIDLYPFVYGAAIAFIPACLVALVRFIDAAARVVKS